MPLGIDLLQVLLHVFNVVLLFGGMYILLYSPVKKFMDKRAEYYADLDRQAKEKLSEADGLKSEYESRLAGVQDEINESRKKAAIEAENAREQRLKDAEKEAEEIIEEARQAASRQRAIEEYEAKREISRLMGEAADKMLFNQNDNSIFDAFLDDAERSNEDA